MRTRLQKWGNSLALRIPQPFAREAHLQQNSAVDLAVVEGRLVVTPVAEAAFTLAVLLAGVTDENLHVEVETGPATGAEAW